MVKRYARLIVLSQNLGVSTVDFDTIAVHEDRFLFLKKLPDVGLPVLFKF